MKLHLNYYANLREEMGLHRETIECPSTVTTVQALREWLAGRNEQGAISFAPGRVVRCAVNQTVVNADASIKSDDQIALFPPVTGG
jgi:sulfur-carrier protein